MCGTKFVKIFRDDFGPAYKFLATTDTSVDSEDVHRECKTVSAYVYQVQSVGNFAKRSCHG